MAPREATNVFPDQYLTLEYDTSGPPVLPHDPTPVGIGGDNLNMNVGQDHDVGAFEHHVNQVMNEATNDNNNINNPIDFMGNTENEGIQPSSSSAGMAGLNSQSMDQDDTSSGIGHGSANSRSHHVDPLSIDPTSDEENPMSIPSTSMEFLNSFHPHSNHHPQGHVHSVSTPASSPASTQMAPWSGTSLSSMSSPPSFFTPPHHHHNHNLDDSGDLDPVEQLRRRSMPPAVSPLPGTNSNSPYAHARHPNSSISISGSQSQSQNQYMASVSGSYRWGQPSLESQHSHPGMSNSHSHSNGRVVVSPEGYSLHHASSTGGLGLSRRRLRRIVTDSGRPFRASLDMSIEDGDDDQSLASFSQPHNMDITIDSSSTQDLDEHEHGADDTHSLTESSSSNQSFLNRVVVRGASNSHSHPNATTDHAEQSQSSHDLLSTGTLLPIESSPDSTPTHTFHRSMHHLIRNNAFDNSPPQSASHSPLSTSTTHSMYNLATPSASPSSHNTSGNYHHPSNSITHMHRITTAPAINVNANVNANSQNLNPNSQLGLAFGPNTKVSDLKYFAERGCIVALLSALHTPRLKTLGCRMLADYAKMPSRRVAVASNKRILQFVIRTIHEFCEKGTDTVEWLGREYAVETVRSLTATEESDGYLMNCPGMLKTLALCAQGGPFLRQTHPHSTAEGSGEHEMLIGLASGRARLHACIAIMNLSCGKSNKVEIAKLPEVLEAMRDAMLMSNPTLLQHNTQSGLAESKRHAEEARLKATTCIKNLSNADANDAALLKCPGLVAALGHVAAVTSKSWQGSDATTTTNACLALMNLSISKANKHTVFRTEGVMKALMTVISQNEEKGDGRVNVEAKVKACSALSNLAIGYDNKIPMFSYPGFVDAILNVIETDRGEARTKACSILWSFAAEMKNQVPVVRRGDILPVLVRVAEEDNQTEARFKCVAALTLLAESLENAIPLLESGALAPLMDILHDAGPDPTQWKGQTASWCVGFLMNMAQSDEAVPSLREAGVVELLAPLLTLDHYQSLKAAMAVTFVCRYDEGDETYDLLRKTETVIPKIISLLHNTLSGRGGNGYKYGVFTLRSSVGCIASLASGPDFMKERIATKPVYESLLRVLSDFCVDGGTPGAIVGGGRDDTLSPTLAVRALHDLTGHLIPVPGAGGTCGLPFGRAMDEKLKAALASFSVSPNLGLKDIDRQRARETRNMILGNEILSSSTEDIAMPPAIVCCGLPPNAMVSARGSKDRLAVIQAHPSPSNGEIEVINTLSVRSTGSEVITENLNQGNDQEEGEKFHVRTFLLADSRGRRFAVPIDPSGGRSFNDNRVWCYRRGRFCRHGETPDPNFVWTRELQRAYMAALAIQGRGNAGRSGQHRNMVTSNSF